MNILYKTTNTNAAKEAALAEANKNKMEFHCFKGTKEGIENILSLNENNDNLVIFLEGITKSRIFDPLLKVLEEQKKNIVVFATTNYDISEALESRFCVMQVENSTTEAEEFLATRKTKQIPKLDFYIELAELVVDRGINIQSNLAVIDKIVSDAGKTTTNTFWDYYFQFLQKNFRW